MVNEQAAALQRAKRQALGLLLLVTGVFIISSLLERSLWTDALQATAEAAMVGALADWFAVRALFHRVPIPWVVRHTAIIPRNKDRIGQNLAVFVRDRFLDPASLVGLLRRHDVVERMAQWLLLPDNARYLGQQVARMLAAALDMVQDRQIEHLLRKALRALHRPDANFSPCTRSPDPPRPPPRAARRCFAAAHGPIANPGYAQLDCTHHHPLAQKRASAQRKNAALRLAQ